MDRDGLQRYLRELRDLPEYLGCETVDVHTRGGWMSTPLHTAAVQGNVEAIAALLDAGADIHSRGEHGFSPLHEAVEQGHIDAVRLLLTRGASPTAQADDGHTPIDEAVILKRGEIEALLRDRLPGAASEPANHALDRMPGANAPGESGGP